MQVFSENETANQILKENT